jgi:uncharacterized membrane protein YeaQ/YmgE (transglycosylase-associated protein family)
VKAFKKLLLIEFVVFSTNVLIGIASGLLYQKISSSTHGYFTSSVIGISGSYLGYSLVYYSLYFSNMHWHAMPIRLIGAIVGAAVILGMCRPMTASA